MNKNIHILSVIILATIIISLLGNIIFHLSIVLIFISIFSIISIVLSIIKQKLVFTVFSVILICLVSLFSFFVIQGGYIIYLLLFPVWFFCIILLIFTIIKSVKVKRNYFLNYIMFFSILSTFAGEIYVHYLNNYLEKELTFIAKEIEEFYENTNKKYNSKEIIKLLEEYNYDKLDVSFNKSENDFFISGITHTFGKPLMNLSFYISEDNYFIIHGVTQELGIPGMDYDSRNKVVDRNYAKEFYLFYKAQQHITGL